MCYTDKNQVIFENQEKWTDKKVRNLKLSEAYKSLDRDKKARAVELCATTLQFATNKNTGKKYLLSGMFCRDRLCPVCQWRRKLNIFSGLTKIFNYIDIENLQKPYKQKLQPVFLTLTLKNCRPDELPKMLDLMFDSWRKLTKIRKINRQVKGFFRSLEITYNPKTQTYHPHIHAILLFERNYFYKQNAEYMDIMDWQSEWKSATGVDYEPIIDIRKIYGTRAKAAAEVGKYTVKDTDYLTKYDFKLDVINILSGALYGRRIVSSGGIIAKIQKQLKIHNIEQNEYKDELSAIRNGSVYYIFTNFNWNFGFGIYEKNQN